MDGETLKMVFKTLYGVIPYTLTVMLAITWFGIGLGSMRGNPNTTPWVLLSMAAVGYAGLFLMLAIIASGNPLFGQEANAWFLRTFTLVGAVFLGIFTWLYLMRKWRNDNGRHIED